MVKITNVFLYTKLQTFVQTGSILQKNVCTFLSLFTKIYQNFDHINFDRPHF